MSNKGGWLRYRCRMCGEEYQNVHVPDVAQAVCNNVCERARALMEKLKC